MKDTINKIKSYILKSEEAKFIALAILLLATSRLINAFPADDFTNSHIIVMSSSFVSHAAMLLLNASGTALIVLSINIISVKTLYYFTKLIIDSKWYIQLITLAAIFGFLFSYIVCSEIEGGIYSSNPLISPYFIILFFIYSVSTWLFIYILAYAACIEDIIKDIKINKSTLLKVKKVQHFLLVFLMAMTLLMAAFLVFSLPHLDVILPSLDVIDDKVVIVPFLFLLLPLWMLILFAMLAPFTEQEEPLILPPEKKIKKNSHIRKNKTNRSNRRKSRLSYEERNNL